MAEPAEQPSIIGAYAIAIGCALEQRGVDPRDVFDECGIPMPTVVDPLRRLDNKDVSRLFAAAVAHTNDPAIGLLAGESMRPGNLHALGYALLSSTTLRDFCERLKNYYRIVSQNAVLQIEESSDSLVLTAHAPSPDICWETHDAFAALIIRLVRFIHSPAFSPRSLQLMRPDPGEFRDQYSDYFCCPIDYGCECIRIYLDLDIVDQQLPGASKELAVMHDQAVRQYLQQIEKADIVNRVRSIVVEELASHTLSKQQVADRLCMSPRSLQLKLAERHTSFQEILDSTRRTLALAYMEQANITITEAAYLVGFSEVSNFTRAFRRWTGRSPRDFRRDMGID